MVHGMFDMCSIVEKYDIRNPDDMVGPTIRQVMENISDSESSGSDESSKGKGKDGKGDVNTGKGTGYGKGDVNKGKGKGKFMGKGNLDDYELQFI